MNGPIFRDWLKRGKEIRVLRADLARVSEERDVYEAQWLKERQERLDAELLAGWMGR